MASAVEDVLTRVNQAANDVNAFANALAEKVRAGGDVAIRASNTAYGAAGGAKAGSQVPTQIPDAVKYGAALLAVYFLFGRRR